MKKKDIDFTYASEDGRASRRNVRLAVLLALVAGVLLVGVFIAVRHLDFSKPETPEETTLPVPVTETGEDAQHRFLVVVNDGPEVCLVALVNVDAAKNSLQVKPLSKDLEIVSGRREGAIGELFGDVGVTGVKTGVEEKFGMTIDRWLGITAAHFKNLFLLLGETEIFFDRDVSFSVDAIKYTYRRGPASLTGDALLAAVKNAYEGDENVAFGGKALASVLQDHLTVENLEKGEEFYAKIVNLLDSNFTAFDYVDYKDAAVAFLSASPEITVVS